MPNPVFPTTLAESAWRLGELDRFVGDPDIDELIVEAVRIADGELTGDTSTQATIDDARALVLARHAIELAAQDRVAADVLAAAVEAGDCREDGSWIEYPRYQEAVCCPTPDPAR